MRAMRDRVRRLSADRAAGFWFAIVGWEAYPPRGMSAQYKIIGGDGREYGPATLDELRTWCDEGRVGPKTLVWKSDDTSWQPASQRDELKWDLKSDLEARDETEADPLAEFAAQHAVTRPAGFWVRLGAHIIDWMVLTSLLTLLTLPWGEQLARLQEEALQQVKSSNPDSQILLQFMLISLSINLPLTLVYQTFFNGRTGATPGKRLMGLRVERADGTPLGYSRAAIRCLAEMVTSLTVGIGYLMIAFNPDKKALHDLIAKTRVVHR